MSVISTSLIFYYDEKYLICNEDRSIYKGGLKIPLYHLIGGKVENEELPYNSALREFVEETNFKINIDLKVEYKDFIVCKNPLSKSYNCIHRFYICNLKDTSKRFRKKLLNYNYEGIVLNNIYWYSKEEIISLKDKTSLLKEFTYLI